MITYKIGTRGSLLAVTQSTLIKNELERISGEKFELVLIQTQGDQITNKPLWQLEGKDFFTKELDEALLNESVDFVIHSYKDLGSERPEGIKLAAVTERRFAHDILLMPKQIIKDLKDWKGDLVIGTSSPRRIVNLTASLKKYLPYLKNQDTIIRCETLRGNVNTRIKNMFCGIFKQIEDRKEMYLGKKVPEDTVKEITGYISGGTKRNTKKKKKRKTRKKYTRR